jgi:SEC-C motif-containing protein
MRVIASECPCGTGERYDACCGVLHRGAAQAASAEELMRSRYSAYAVGDTDYVWRTWHPRTRPHEVTPHADMTWTGLTVLDATEDEVEFRATYDQDGSPGVLHERSRFERRRDRWVYVDATIS